MVGSWDIQVVTGGMPQKVATAFAEATENLLGAEYVPIAYLGSQVVNGINHAVLAEQILTVGRDVKNIVLMIFNQKEDKVTLSNIERVVQSGDKLGGIIVDVKETMPEDATEALDKVLSDMVGSKVEPFVYLGEQVTKGTNYIFAATVTPVTLEPQAKVMIVVVNAMENKIYMKDLLGGNGLGYAFTWLKNPGFGTPLGEWP